MLSVLVFGGLFATACSSGKKSKFLVSVFYNNGTQATAMVDANSVFSPTDPSESKFYEFKGWFTDKEFKNRYDKTSKITKDISLYAAWEAKQVEFEGIELIAKQMQDIVMLAEKLGYNGKDAQIKSCQFIRGERYNTTEWERLCGAVPFALKTKIESEIPESYELSALQEVFYLDQNVDFLHFAAVLNTVLMNGENSAETYVCNFIGDLAQVVEEVNGTEEEMYEQAVSKIGASSGSFSSSDFWADVLGSVIASRAIIENVSFAELVPEVFLQDKNEILSIFAEIYFGETTKDNIISAVEDAFKTPYVLVWLARKEAISMTAIRQVATAFAEFYLQQLAEE